jgi:predicted Fe-Mo cluster-binding NifX family protein
MGLQAMKVAIPVWEDKVSPVFDTATRLLVLQVENNREAGRFETLLEHKDLGRRCALVQGLGIDVLICGAISRHFSGMLAAGGVDVIAWISGPAQEVIDAFMAGSLLDSRFLMPGCNRPEL